MASWKEHPAIAVPLAMQKRYKQDAAEQLAAAIGFFAFLSLVPLLLLSVAVAGVVLDDPERQVQVALALTEALPGFDATVAAGEPDEGVSALIETVVAQRGTVGLIGLVTLLLTGQRVIASAMAATRVVFRGGVVSGVSGWVRKLTSMVVLGVTALASVGLASVAGFDVGFLPRPATVILSILASLVLDLLFFLVAYRILSTTTSMRWRDLVPGALFAAVGWTVLKVFGSTWVAGQVADANALYGALGGVIALLLLLYLAGRLYLYGAELSAVLVERRDGPLEVAEDDADADADDQARGGDAPAQAPSRTHADADGHGEAGRRDGVPHDGVDPRPPRGYRRRVGTRPLHEAAGPPPVPRRARVRPVDDPGPLVHLPVTAATAERLAAADERNAEVLADRGRHVRTAAAVALGLAALGIGWRFLGPEPDQLASTLPGRAVRRGSPDEPRTSRARRSAT